MVVIDEFKAYALAHWQLDLELVHTLTAHQVSQLAVAFHLSEDECLLNLLPMAARYALVPISQFFVGAIAKGTSGHVYFGANMEFSGVSLSQTIHAEQAAFNNAWLANEEGISDIYVNESPCGYCRQFLNELTTSESLVVHIQGRQARSLQQFLPDSFGPNDLGISKKLMSAQSHQQNLSVLPDIYQVIWSRSYAPYSQSPSICVVTLESGISYYGAYAENAAFNPSLSPFQSALIQVRLAGAGFDQIKRVELYEQEDAKIFQYNICYSLFQAISPTAQWHYETV
jgi:cytidine deaminase